MDMDIGDIDVKRLRLQSGDVVVIRLDTVPTRDQAKAIQESFRGLIPHGVKTMILAKGVDIEVLTEAEAGA
jgi:hypothetical protein